MATSLQLAGNGAAYDPSTYYDHRGLRPKAPGRIGERLLEEM